MHQRSKRSVARAGVLALAIGGTVMAVPASAQAASYNGACGSGYSTIDHRDLNSGGTVYLTYNRSNGNNCVVTVRNNPGPALLMLAGLKKAGASTWADLDEKYYTSYAGPVYLHAPNSCIDWEGGIGENVSGGFDSHCG
ncbi:spore-associated protein A [Kitasatospora sp. NPDC094015]|uniref:spore-associated protein A n=1 Tax=Kitasatospora sp. NPDC094015 TaxID=3155205 RepID=UPI00331CD5F5